MFRIFPEKIVTHVQDLDIIIPFHDPFFRSFMIVKLIIYYFTEFFKMIEPLRDLARDIY